MASKKAGKPNPRVVLAAHRRGMRVLKEQKKQRARSHTPNWKKSNTPSKPVAGRKKEPGQSGGQGPGYLKAKVLSDQRDQTGGWFGPLRLY